MKLIEIVDNSKTDKNTVHSYLPLYRNRSATVQSDFQFEVPSKYHHFQSTYDLLC